jgi:hypothetical protein
MYIDIAIPHFIAFKKSEDQLNVIEEKYKIIDSEEKLNAKLYERSKPREELIHSYIQTIIFSALAVEAYIYDFGASQINDEYVLNHLDKLGLLDKWVIIPRLIFNQDMDKSKKWFELLKKLIYTRNNFIHSKSKDWDPERWESDEKYRNKFNIVYNDKNILASDAIKLLDLLTREIDINDTNKINKFKLFDIAHYLDKYPELMNYKKLI